MAKSYEDDDEDKVTLHDFNKNLCTYSIKRLKRLANVLIDFVIELTIERDSMDSSLDGLNEEMEEMVVQMSFLEEQMMVFESEKMELKEQLI